MCVCVFLFFVQQRLNKKKQFCSSTSWEHTRNGKNIMKEADLGDIFLEQSVSLLVFCTFCFFNFMASCLSLFLLTVKTYRPIFPLNATFVNTGQIQFSEVIIVGLNMNVTVVFLNSLYQQFSKKKNCPFCTFVFIFKHACK